MTHEELYQFEHWLELGFASILAGTCPKIYKSREPLDLESPRVEIKAIIGNAMSDHAKGFADGSEAYDAFDGSLEITVVTNRSTTEGTLTHDQLLGAVRSRLTMRYLKACNPLSNWQSPALAPTDLRATGTADTFFDGNDTDTTVLSYFLVFSVKQAAWNQDVGVVANVATPEITIEKTSLTFNYLTAETLIIRGAPRAVVNTTDLEDEAVYIVGGDMSDIQSGDLVTYPA
jgi:hypothetical protein